MIVKGYSVTFMQRLNLDALPSDREGADGMTINVCAFCGDRAPAHASLLALQAVRAATNHIATHVEEMCAQVGPICTACFKAFLAGHRPCYDVDCGCACSP